ncbi:hypothetical protein ACFSL4_17730 [Streptomyces caeni]|uniref:Zinc ribbon domain-containing protein n=1 Tax=Streptomyces caeni TaxID=2307231 RepID=A0ABW4IRK6_9ACTN
MQDRTPDGPVRELLASVLEALNIPHPATIGDTEQHDRVLNERVMHARIALVGVLERGDDPAWTTAYLRERLAEHPPTGYRHHGTPPPPSCGKCRKPFDPADTRFDGRARHGETPWCRRCVDSCHESTDAFHACPICDPTRRGGEGR